MNAKKWFIGWSFLVSITLCILGWFVYKIDPFFHWHMPNLDSYYYTLDNPRSQNTGIMMHFDYDALITGTSMTENFKSSEMNEIWGVNSIKVPFSGATYKEINDQLIIALENNPNLKTIVRGLDYGMFFDNKDRMRLELGDYPTYLYDSNPFNDVKYLFNKDVLFRRVYAMTKANDNPNFVPGITKFDNYCTWQHSHIFGINKVAPNGVSVEANPVPIHLTDSERQTIFENISQNVTSLAEKYPDVDFYYFFTPYSAVWWNALVNDGTIYKQIEAEQYIIELILEHENIHLYSFNNRTDITTDLNNYKDNTHYGQWINTLILQWMYDGKYLLTSDNYLEYLDEELSFYTNFDYESLNHQTDYEYDFYAAAILNAELKGIEPIDLLNDNSVTVTTSDNTEGQYTETKIQVSSLENRDYLVFSVRTLIADTQSSIVIYNNNNSTISETLITHNPDNNWHQYGIDLSELNGDISIVLKGGTINNNNTLEHPKNPAYLIQDITLY